MPTTDHHPARDAGAERVHPHLTLVGAQALLQRLEYSGHTLDGVMVDVRLDDLRNVAPVLRDYVAAADRAPPTPRPEAVPDRAQVLDRYMSLHGATLADRREAERYLAYVLDGPDREGVPPLRGPAAPAPTVEAMAEALWATERTPSRENWAEMLAFAGEKSEVAAETVAPYRARAAAVLARLALVTKTDAAADPAPAPLAGAVRDAGSFLLDRLEEFGNDDAFSGDGCRDWHGHVWPAVVRFRAALPAEGAAGDGWSMLDDCPSAGEPLWVFGGPYEEPTRRSADGEWWRSSRARGFSTPTHWRHDRVPAPPRDGGRP